MFMYSWEDREMGDLTSTVQQIYRWWQRKEELRINEHQQTKGPCDSWQRWSDTSHVAFLPQTLNFQQTPDLAKDQSKPCAFFKLPNVLRQRSSQELRSSSSVFFCIAPLNMKLTCMYSVGDLYSWYMSTALSFIVAVNIIPDGLWRPLRYTEREHWAEKKE